MLEYGQNVVFSNIKRSFEVMVIVQKVLYVPFLLKHIGMDNILIFPADASIIGYMGCQLCFVMFVENHYC
jgi:hypothetical protein